MNEDTLGDPPKMCLLESHGKEMAQSPPLTCGPAGCCPKARISELASCTCKVGGEKQRAVKDFRFCRRGVEIENDFKCKTTTAGGEAGGSS